MEDIRVANKHMKTCIIMKQSTGSERGRKEGLRPILVTFYMSFNPHKRLQDVDITNLILQRGNGGSGSLRN